MNRPIIKFLADFGPLLIFFTIYFSNENDLKAAIPPFIIATLIALVAVYLLEKRNNIVMIRGNEYRSEKDFEVQRLFLDFSQISNKILLFLWRGSQVRYARFCSFKWPEGHLGSAFEKKSG